MSLNPTSSHGGGGLALTGGTLTGPLVIDYSAGSGNDIPLQVKGSWNAQNVDFLSIFNTDTSKDMLAFDSTASLEVNDHTSGAQLGIINRFGEIHTVLGFVTQVITSGALPTVAPVSGAAFQTTIRDTFLVIPFTGDASNNAATLKIELSPDNVTFSTLDTLSIAAALNLTGALNVPVTIFVPSAWYVKLTAVHGTIGTCTYY